MRCGLFLPLIGILMSISGISSAQEVWPQRSERLYQACWQNVNGKSLDYLQNLRPPNLALVLDNLEDGLSIGFESEPLPTSLVEDSISLIFSATFLGKQEETTSLFELQVEDIDRFVWHSYEDFRGQSIVSDNGSLQFIPAKHESVESGIFGYFMLNIATASIPSDKHTLKFKVTHNPKESVSRGMHFFQDSIFTDLKAWCMPSLRYTEDNQLVQPLIIEWFHLQATVNCRLTMGNEELAAFEISPGRQVLEVELEPIQRDTSMPLLLFNESEVIDSIWVQLRKVDTFEVHLLPHSHVDIGFTHRQEDVLEMQWEAIRTAIQLGQETAHYPKEARFKWNVEVLWAVDEYLKQASDEEKNALIVAIKDGTIGLDALYATMLTGIQKPEELMRNTFAAHKLRDEYGLDIQSAMTTDVPGAQWATVQSLTHNGVKYLNIGPNHMPHMPDLGYQVGHTLKTWGDRPFYWTSISGEERVLVWMSSHGYSWFHPWLLGNIRKKEGQPILKFLADLQSDGYPYDMVQLRYTLGDNAGPDGDLSDFVREWNEQYATPKLVINTNQAMFEQFESKYKHTLPVFKGDFTPYWEDGVASSAFETALNRKTAEQIIQAEILYTRKDIEDYPKAAFDEAWRNILLFSEHTWGSHTSKSDPDGQLPMDQWAVKESFANKAASIVDSLLLGISASQDFENTGSARIEVVNTHPFSTREIVYIDALTNPERISVLNEAGQHMTTQLLSNGQLAFSTDDVSPLSSTSYFLERNTEIITGQNHPADNFILDCDDWVLALEEEGNSISINDKDGTNYLKEGDSLGFNRFWYSGVDTTNWSGASLINVTWEEYGPLLHQIRLLWEAPGCDSIVSFLSCNTIEKALDIENLVYKKKVLADENGRFVFPFDINKPAITMDHPFAVMRPGVDQIEGSNVNFFCAQRWVHLESKSANVLWLSKDAPIVEFGEPHGQRWASDLKKRPWLKTFQPNATLFSWVFNNVWFVNYKGYQEGIIPFRYRMYPGLEFDQHICDQKGLSYNQPLVLSYISDEKPSIDLPIQIEGDAAIRLSGIRPTRDQTAWVVRLYNASDKVVAGRLKWNKPFKAAYRTDGTEQIGEIYDLENITFQPWEIVTIMID